MTDSGRSAGDISDPSSHAWMDEALSARLTGAPAVGSSAQLVRRIGSLSWALVGIVVVLLILLAVLALISELVLPVVFGAVLAVIFSPACRRLEQRGWRPALASLVVVVALVAVTTGVVLLAVNAVVDELDAWQEQIGRAIDEAAESTTDVGLGADRLDAAREAFSRAGALVGGGVVSELVGGVGAVFGFLAGAVLAVLVLYYLLKDGAAVRVRLTDWFSDAARPEADALFTRSTGTIRAYGAARTVLSVMVAAVITVWSALLGLPMLGTIAVVNFMGGYVPYIGAVVGGAVAVVLAMAERGVAAAVATLVLLLLVNLALENLVEPRVMGSRLDIHPLTVLLVTTGGGIVGGIVGLILAVPLFVVTMDGIATFQRHALDVLATRGGSRAGRGETDPPDPGRSVVA